MPTLLVQDQVYRRHRVPAGHVERPQRLEAIDAALAADRFSGLARRGAPPPADDAVLATAHRPAYIDAIRAAIPATGIAQIEADTFVGPETFTVAAQAAAGACVAVDAVMGGAAANAFCAVRPPGHHAGADTAMGFCIFNNAVIAARHAQGRHGAGRVAIVDWDVHHGNGTQAIVEADASILYCSTHQMPLYPGTGDPSETGVGNIVNVPLAPGDGSVAFRRAFAAAVIPAVDAFRPDLVVISAGFDAHARDPLGELALGAEDFGWATAALMEVAGRHCAGRIVSLLEGGYDLTGLADSVAAHVAALMTA